MKTKTLIWFKNSNYVGFTFHTRTFVYIATTNPNDGKM